MDDREQQRMRLTRDVLRMLRVRDFRSALPPARPGEPVAILVCFRDDTLKTVLEKTSLLGESVYVVVPPRDLELWPAGLSYLQVIKSDKVGTPGTMTDDDCLVNESSHLEMLLQLLAIRKRTMTLHLCRHETTVELVDDGMDLALR